MFTINEILSNTFKFYGQNFKKTMLFSLPEVLILLLTYASMISAFFVNPNTPSAKQLTALLITMSFIVVLLTAAVLAIIFMPRITMAYQIFITKKYDGEDLSFGEAYRLTRGRYGVFFGNSILVGLMVSAPTILVMMIGTPMVILLAIKSDFFAALAPYLPLILSVVSLLISTFIGAIFITMIPTVSNDQYPDICIKKSAMMIKGQYLKSVAIYFLTTTLLGIATTIITSYASTANPWSVTYGNPPQEAILLGVGLILLVIVVSVLISPLRTISSALVYRKTNGKNIEIED